MSQTLIYDRGATLPDAQLWIFDDDGILVDLSAYTFTYFRIGHANTAPVLNKTTGITGAAGTGVEPTGTPNCTIVWATDDLDVAATTYTWNLEATSGGKKRKWKGSFVINDVLPEPAAP